MAGTNNSKELIDTYGFLSSKPSFFAQLIVFLDSKQEPSSLTEAVRTIRECIDFFQSSVLENLQNDPYSKIHKFVLESLGTDDLLVGNSPIEDLMNFQRRIHDICEKHGQLAQYEIGKDFKKYKDNYMELVDGIVLVKSIILREDSGTFLYIMKVLSMLAAIEFGAMKEFFKSENYIRHANRPKLSKGQKKRYKEHSEETKDAVFETIKRMISGDTRLHDKIVEDVVREFNDPIVNPIRKELKIKYPNYDIEGHPDMKEYEKEYQKRTHGKLLSKEPVKEGVFDFALRVYGQANDPLKNTRNIIPIIRRDKEKE